MNYNKFPERKFNHIISSPFIYMMILPLFILDLFIEIFHQICFRVYNIPLINRAKYIQVDRHELEYLHLIDKINCAYCGYANGLLAYASEIAAETEKYWCGIKHAKNNTFKPLKHQKDFIEYGDEIAYLRLKKTSPKCKLNQAK